MATLRASPSPGKRPRSSDDGTSAGTALNQDVSKSNIENDPTTEPIRINMGRGLLIGGIALVGAIGFLVVLSRSGSGHDSNPLASTYISRTLSSPYGDISQMDENFASLVDPPDALTETGIFFHIPKAGGSAMEYMYGFCFDLTLATEVGGNPDFVQGIDPSELSVFSTDWEVQMVNVDSTTLDGLGRAKKLGLAQSGLADIIFTSYIHQAAKLFSPLYRGRVFTVMRHPIERAASEFFYLQDASWEETYSPETKSWTIQEYAASDCAEHDWITKQLLGTWQELTEEDLQKAMYILEDKVLIGLIDRMEESVDRFNRYFGWEESPDKVPCAEDMLGHKSSTGSNSHAHPKVVPGSDDWEALAAINRYDIQLYDFAVALFEEQGILFEDPEDEES
mmetsp:Transcript_16969/g.28271  ORF Transcript_16969/g.28271 Transcript_16969/m.28271 type:complete len:394 (-) Transcript_16969:797-1978(-)